MVKYTENQQKIAKTLLEEPMSIDELRKEMDLNAKQLNEELKEMINLGVVERKDDEYKLINFIEHKMGKGPKLEGEYVARFIIEASSKSEEAVEKQMDKLEQSLKKEPYKLLEFERAEVEKEENDEGEGETATTFIETEVTVPKFTDLLYLVVNYGPSSVEVLEPDEINLTVEELQKSLNDLSSAIHYYTGLILQLKKKLNEYGIQE